jgi:hypothetical protein
MEPYNEGEGYALPVCERHRPLIQMIYEDIKASRRQI